MRPKLTLLFLLLFGALASSAYLMEISENKKMGCAKKCSSKKPPAIEQNGGGEQILDGSFNHMIVSTLK